MDWEERGRNTDGEYLCFTNDIVLLTESHTELQKIMKELKEKKIEEVSS